METEAPHNSKGSLFRIEAVENQSQKQYSRILLATPISFRLLTVGTMLTIATIFIFASQTGFTRKETVLGVLVPKEGLVRIFPPQSGVLVQRNVRDGQAVEKDDPLFILSSELVSSQGETQHNVSIRMQSRIQSLKSELNQLRTQQNSHGTSTRRRNADLAIQIAKVQQEITLQRKRVDMASSSAKRFQELRLSQFVSEAQVQEKQAELIDQQSRLATLERAALSMQSESLNYENEATQNNINMYRQAEQLRREIAEIEQSAVITEAQRQLIIRAPKSGVITAMTGELGQRIVPNLSLATIIPASGTLEAELYAPSRAIEFIRSGTKVLLRYHAFPYQRFGQQKGVIREISLSPLQPDEIVAPLAHLANADEPLYRIRVKLDSQSIRAQGASTKIQSGMQLDASLVLEKRTLAEWILDPINTFTGRL